jgi:hypothetical protein
MGKGAPWLKIALIQYAWAGVRKKAATFRASSIGCGRRRGAKKAIGAAATSILTASYHMANGTFYQDLGADHFDRRTKTAHTKRLISRLQNHGYDVQITPLAA